MFSIEDASDRRPTSQGIKPPRPKSRNDSKPARSASREEAKPPRKMSPHRNSDNIKPPRARPPPSALSTRSENRRPSDPALKEAQITVRLLQVHRTLMKEAFLQVAPPRRRDKSTRRPQSPINTEYLKRFENIDNWPCEKAIEHIPKVIREVWKFDKPDNYLCLVGLFMLNR